MNCPVCQGNTGENANQCTECGSDLTAFEHINAVSKQRSALKKASITLGLVLLIAIVGWAATFMTTKTEVNTEIALDSKQESVENDKQVVELKEKTEAQEKEITELQEELSELLATIESSKDDFEVEDEEGSHTVHIVKEGESLWSISEKYHGHGFKHDEIGGHNELGDPHYIKVGDTIIVKH
ncbi:MAG: hypothetical protein COA57_15450 [Flavobacteriales bacterium]|nr:MAG: hypothetical protein COA57_15450 [Flavobacteriales bacterium]